MKTKFFVLGFLYLFLWLLTSFAMGSFAATNISMSRLSSGEFAANNASIRAAAKKIMPASVAAAKYLTTSSDYLPVAGNTIIITAQLVDENNVPLPIFGLTVTWSKSNINGSFASATSITNAGGIATVVFTTHTVATTSITITATDAGGLTGNTLPITTKAGAPAKYVVSTENYFPVAGSVIAILAQLTDIHNNPVRIPGINVTWSKSDINGSFAPAFNTTDGNGQVTTMFTTSNVAAKATTITATCTGFTGISEAITTIAGPAAKYLVNSSNYAPIAGSAVTITAQLADINGNAIHTPGIAVTWSKSDVNGSFSIANSTTDGNGLATVVFTTHSTSATASTITATDAHTVTGTSQAIVTIAGAARLIITDIQLLPETLYENQPSRSLAGILRTTSNSLFESFTYTLVSGLGDRDNDKFQISDSQVTTSTPFDYENQQSYNIRVRSTSPQGLSFDRAFVIQITDVNEAPTLSIIANQTICYTTSEQLINLSDITPGPESSQSVTTSISSDNSNLFQHLGIAGNSISYRIAEGHSGKAILTVKVKDNGGTTNGGMDEVTSSFSVTINSLPDISVTADKGNTVSKGESLKLIATGGNSYRWLNSNGIISGQNSSSLQIRPMETTNYEVQVTNASGCTTIKTLKIEVKEDFTKVLPANNFSPNDDQVNDTWNIANIDAYPDHKLIIFDRGGRILYTAKNYKNDWNGMTNGSRLDEGTYYYVIEFNKPGITPLKGFISIIH